MDEAIGKLLQAEKVLNRVIRGKGTVIRQLLTAVLAGGNVLLDDVPGVGKTTLVKAFAKLLNAKFTRIQFTADLLPADVMGSSIYNPKTAEFVFREGPVFTNVLLADEINRASPRTQSALLESMSEHQVSADGITRPLKPPFVVIATENPVEYQGTYPLPEAQLDRFDLRLSLGYPAESEERQMLQDRAGHDPLEEVTPVLNCGELIELQHRAEEVLIEESVGDYLLEIVRATRGEPRLILGASPRAALRLAACARASALLEGRDFVLPEEVRNLAPAALCHRLILEDKSRYAGCTAADVVSDILKKIKLPR